MAGVLLIELEGLDASIAKIARVADPFERGVFMDSVGVKIENSTKRRFGEKRAPDGSAWPTWSDAHGATRRPGHSLLVESGRLRDGIQLFSRPDEARVGTRDEHGAIHQFGGKAGRGRKVAIPPRPYLGLSERDRRDILDLVEDMVR